MTSMTTQESLKSCLRSITSSNLHLESSIGLLKTSTDDFPRTSTVLKQYNVFTVVPEIDVIQNSTNLKNRIEPQLNSLMDKIDAELQKLKREKASLAHEAELQKIRLDTYRDLQASEAQQQQQDGEENLEVVGDVEELQRLKFLRNKKERLSYSLSRLNLQDNKRRLSMLPN